MAGSDSLSVWRIFFLSSFFPEASAEMIRGVSDRTGVSVWIFFHSI
jgi:hypothetical protein